MISRNSAYGRPKRTRCLQIARIGGQIVAAALLGLSGCTYTGPATGPGSVTISTPGIIPERTQTGISTPPVKAAPRDGSYVGIARVLDDPGGACFSLTQQHNSLPTGSIFGFGADGTIRVTNFDVAHGQVSFGPFTGPINPDGGVNMQAGAHYVFGRFIGSDFVGQFWQPQPGCTFHLFVYPR